MEYISLLYSIVKKHTECIEDTQTLSSASKKTGRGKECGGFGFCDTFYDNEGAATAIHFFKFSSFPSMINSWCNLIKRQTSKDGFYVLLNTVLSHYHFSETDNKKSYLRWKLPLGSAPFLNVPGKTISQNKKEKYQ